MSLELEPMGFEFSGVVAVVAGGANGLGVTIAKGFAEKGAHVYISGDLVENRKQIWELSNLRRGMCTILPKQLTTADELLAEIAEREDDIHFLVDDASDSWGLVFARADAFYDMLLSGTGGASDPAHIITIAPSAHSASPWDSKASSIENARALAAEFSDESVVVNCVEPARNEMDIQNVAAMVMNLCSQSSANAGAGISCVGSMVVPGPLNCKPLPFLQAKL